VSQAAAHRGRRYSHLPEKENQMSTSSLRPNRNGARALGLACSIVAALVGCGGGGHHLAEYPFASRTLAVVYIAPPSPELLTSYYDLSNSQNAVEAVVRAGADVAREREGRRANARLDSASARIDIPAVLAQRTLQRASRYLGTRPVTDENQADYLMEVRMQRFGINAKADEAAYLFTFAEARSGTSTSTAATDSRRTSRARARSLDPSSRRVRSAASASLTLRVRSTS
jgi:hypothetical protein